MFERQRAAADFRMHCKACTCSSRDASRLKPLARRIEGLQYAPPRRLRPAPLPRARAAHVLRLRQGGRAAAGVARGQGLLGRRRRRRRGPARRARAAGRGRVGHREHAVDDAARGARRGPRPPRAAHADQGLAAARPRRGDGGPRHGDERQPAGPRRRPRGRALLGRPRRLRRDADARGRPPLLALGRGVRAEGRPGARAPLLRGAAPHAARGQRRRRVLHLRPRRRRRRRAVRARRHQLARVRRARPRRRRRRRTTRDVVSEIRHCRPARAATSSRASRAKSTS